MTAVALSPDGGGTLRVWSTADGAPLGQLRVYADGSWVASDSREQHYDSSNDGWTAQVYAIRGLEILEPARTREQFYMMGLLSKLWQG